MKIYIFFSILIIGISFTHMTGANDSKLSSIELRNKVFNLHPSDIGLIQENMSQSVWGMVMETGLPKGSYSLVSLAEGTTSLYFSNGGGIIGGGQYESVRKTADSYLTIAQRFYVKGKLVNEFPLPEIGVVNFYFFTFNGVKMYSASEDDLGNKRNELSDLFFAAHGVIGELRNIQKR